MDEIVVGRGIHVVLGAAFGESAGQHRGARISRVVDVYRSIIDAHVDLLPVDVGLNVDDPVGTLLAGVMGSGSIVYCGLLGHFLRLPYSEDDEPGSWHWIREA